MPPTSIPPYAQIKFIGQALPPAQFDPSLTIDTWTQATQDAFSLPGLPLLTQHGSGDVFTRPIGVITGQIRSSDGSLWITGQIDSVSHMGVLAQSYVRVGLLGGLSLTHVAVPVWHPGAPDPEVSIVPAHMGLVKDPRRSDCVIWAWEDISLDPAAVEAGQTSWGQGYDWRTADPTAVKAQSRSGVEARGV